MLGAALNVPQYIDRLHKELDRVDHAEIARMADLIYQAWHDERFVFIFGNGGSGTTASHFSEDLGKNTLHERDLKDETRLAGAPWLRWIAGPRPRTFAKEPAWKDGFKTTIRWVRRAFRRCWLPRRSWFCWGCWCVGFGPTWPPGRGSSTRWRLL